jgi:hypothetical protein
LTALVVSAMADDGVRDPAAVRRAMGQQPRAPRQGAGLTFGDGARPVVYAKGQAGNLYTEEDHGLRRCRQIMSHPLAAAPGQSPALIQEATKEMKP